MYKRIIISLFTLFGICQINAQISEGGLPPSFKYDNSFRSKQSVKEIPIRFNTEDLLLVDKWQEDNGSPQKVATCIPVNINTYNSGEKINLPKGETIWQLRINAKGAIALMLYYKEFFIPDGGKLFIYNADKTQILGAYTSKTNPRKGRFATEFVAGDDLILEYVYPPSGDAPQIEIEEIGYGYNHLKITSQGELRSSSSCMVNINCSEGAAWQTEKKGVCHTIQKIGNSSYICSGSLINNTAKDFKPYILMAYHCMESAQEKSRVTKVSSPEDFKQWMFYFNFERLGCTQSAPALYKTMTGCTKVASTPMHRGSDGLLLLLDQDIPIEYDVFYNGWDRRNTAPESGVGIHHPKGDYKKISTYTAKGQQSTWHSESSIVGARNAHWMVRFAQTENGHGITEGGSSGSPLFNAEHLIVGTLSGGNSSCLEPYETNLYGKMAYHWNMYALADTARMDIWLDPGKTGVETLTGLYRSTTKPIPSELNISYKNKNATLTWKAPLSTEKPLYYHIYRSNQLIGTTQKTSYSDNNVNLLGEVNYAVTAMYTGNRESSRVSGNIFIANYKPPTDLSVQSEDYKTRLNWKAPYYTQAISWSQGNEPSEFYSLLKPAYLGHSWLPEDLHSIRHNTIKAVEFFTETNSKYSLLITQGSRTYTQPIRTPLQSGIITIDLNTPFVIDSSAELIVAVHIDNYGAESKRIAAFDSGPAVIGKGNLLSEDGKEWFVLFDGNKSSNEDDDFDINFYLATIISSEKGQITRLSNSVKKQYNKNLIRYSSDFGLRNEGIASFRSTYAERSQLQYPAAFPEITGYNVYRNSQLIASLPSSNLFLTDRQTVSGTQTYAVSAVYSDIESDKIYSDPISVSNQIVTSESVGISPTLFSEQIRLTNSHKVDKLEIYAINGKLMKQIKSPNETINTGFLNPGVYIFRLYTQEGIKTIQTIKK